MTTISYSGCDHSLNKEWLWVDIQNNIFVIWKIYNTSTHFRSVKVHFLLKHIIYFYEMKNITEYYRTYFAWYFLSLTSLDYFCTFKIRSSKTYTRTGTHTHTNTQCTCNIIPFCILLRRLEDIPTSAETCCCHFYNTVNLILTL